MRVRREHLFLAKKALLIGIRFGFFLSILSSGLCCPLFFFGFSATLEIQNSVLGVTKGVCVCGKGEKYLGYIIIIG